MSRVIRGISRSQGSIFFLISHYYNQSLAFHLAITMAVLWRIISNNRVAHMFTNSQFSGIMALVSRVICCS